MSMRAIRFIIVGLLGMAACVGVAGATPFGEITEFSSGFSPGAIPGSLTPGADGNLWFTDRGTTAMGQITTAGVVSEFSGGFPAGSIPGAGSGGGVSYGPDGNIWFTDSGTKAIGVFDLVTHAVSEFKTGLNPGSLPSSLVTGSDGNIWFSDQGTTKAMGVVCLSASPLCTASDVASHAIHEFSAGLNAGSVPGIPTFGPDGNIWFADGARRRRSGGST